MAKILIAEDDTVLLDVLRSKLTLNGHEVTSATNGEEAFRFLKSSKPDLILLDILMPLMGGFEILEAISKDPQLKKIPVIVISNSGQPVEIERALKLGAKDYLVKAIFDPEEVLNKVQQHLTGGSGRDSTSLGADLPPAKSSSTVVLVVEDDKFLRGLLIQKLKKENFQVLEAIDGEEGVRITKEKRPNLVLLDLILPGVDGFGVLEQVKKDPKTKDIPVIILSNLGQKDDVEKGMNLGATDYLVKAYLTPSEVVGKIRETLKM